MPNPAINEVDNVYGRLTVRCRDGSKLYGDGYVRAATWLCDCECGTKDVVVVGRDLRVGHTRSCGCLVKDVRKAEGKVTKEANRWKTDAVVEMRKEKVPLVFIAKRIGTTVGGVEKIINTHNKAMRQAERACSNERA